MNPMELIIDYNTWYLASEAEALRSGHNAVDIDHVLCGLLSTGGQVARAASLCGLTLPEARRAVSDIEREDLAHLGLTPPKLTRPDNSRACLPMTQRVKKMFDSVRSHRESALLLALLDHPSGVGARIAARCGADVDEIRRAVADMGTQRVATIERGKFQARGWSPAPLEDMWRIVNDNALFFGSYGWSPVVEETPAGVRWSNANGRPKYEQLFAETSSALGDRKAHKVWRITCPAFQTGPQQLCVELEPDAGGTALTLTREMPRRTGAIAAVTRVIGWPLRLWYMPMMRQSYSLQVQRLVAASVANS